MGVLSLGAAWGAEVEHLVPFYQYRETLVAAQEKAEGKYLAFPVTVRLDEANLLIGYKHGFAHAFDREADFALLPWNTVTERVGSPPAPLHRDRVTLQNGEFVRFGNGEIACYVDAQAAGRDSNSNEATRLGLIEFRSGDNGRTFRDVGRLGPIDGVEYGYVFEAITEGRTTWMLAMTFANLPGGTSVLPSRPKAGAVAVLRSDDDGKTWRWATNLTETFQSPLNESSFLRYQDGFIFACRPYTDEQLLVVTDGAFKVRRRVDLVAQHDFVAKGMGRPRLFTRDGRFYLLGRNTFKPGAVVAGLPAAPAAEAANRMRLSLMRFDPATLAIEKHVVLDNAENQRVVSAYYATPYWQARKGKTYLNLITYKQMSGRMPDIIRCEYEWDEVK